MYFTAVDIISNFYITPYRHFELEFLEYFMKRNVFIYEGSLLRYFELLLSISVKWETRDSLNF